MGQKILLVDDDQDILNIMALELKRNGFTPFLCSNVKDAIEELSKNRFECAIIDIMMGPNETSDEVIKFLKDAGNNILNFDLPMIIISAHVNDELRTRMISKDPLIVDAIKKPLAKNQLSQKIQEIFKAQSLVDDELDMMFRPFSETIEAKEPITSKEAPTPQIEALRQAGINLLMHYAYSGDYIGVQEELIKNPDATVMDRSFDGKTCLHYGARGGNLELVDFLLESGLSIHEKDKKNREPLYEAINVGDIEMCKHLIAKGASTDSKVDEKTYLMLTAALNNLELFELFLKEGLNPDITDAEGKSVKVYLKANKQHDFLNILDKYLG